MALGIFARSLLGVLCVCVWLMWTISVSAAGGVIVSPAKIVAEVRMGAKLPPITICNSSQERITVEVTIGEGRHDLHGIPVMTNEIRPNDPMSPLEIHPTQFSLAPGRSQVVQARVRQPVDGGLYPVIYFSIHGEGPNGGAVQAERRLAVLTLLTEPGEAVPTPVIEDILLSQSEKGAPVHLTSVVSNPGRRHLTIYGQTIISGESGKDTMSLPPVTILPGCSRQLEVVWRPELLPAGLYQGELALRVEDGKTVQQSFPVLAVGPYELAQPLLETGGWRAQIPPLSHELVLEGIVRNSGNVALSPTVEVEVFGCPSPLPVAVGTLKPQEAKHVTIPLPDAMEGGVYDLQVLVTAKTYNGFVKQAVNFKLQVDEANVVALSPTLP